MKKDNRFPLELINIVNYLKNQEINFTKKFSDGRINASINEDELIKIIQKFNQEIIIPKSRAWFDFAIKRNEEIYPVNIKITETTHADNLNCKLGIYYALTGIVPDFANEISWLNYFNKLNEHKGTNKDKDYYFLIVNKQNSKDIFVNSLKGIQFLQPNGNNLPFQCKWENNRNYIERDYIEAEEFILTTFGESIKLRSEIYLNYKKLFNKYV
jgi:hypothetical protein